MPKREKNIYKRCDGRYEGRYIKGYGEDGRAQYGAVYAKTYPEVKEKLEKVKSSPPQGESGGKQTAKSVIGDYLVRQKILIKPSTYGIYERYLTNYISPYFGNRKCHTLTQKIIQAFADHLIQNGLSVKTTKSVFSFLKAGLTGAADEGVFEIRLPKHAGREAVAFSLDEQRRLEAAASGSDAIDHLGVILCLYTGIRLGELCGLMWTDVDFGSNNLHIRRTIQRIKSDGDAKTQIAFMTPKSQSSARRIPLPPFLSELLQSHKCETGGEYILSRNGNPIEPRNFQYRFKNLIADAAVKSATCHSMRHTFCTRALESGMDVKTLSEIVGHASPTITLNQYAHSLDEHKRNSMESIATFIRA